MLWIVVVGFFALVLIANYLVLRSRPADRDAIAAFVASAGVEQISLRRGLLRMWDGADGKTGLSAWTAPSRAARIYVLITPRPEWRTLPVADRHRPLGENLKHDGAVAPTTAIPTLRITRLGL